MKGGRERKEWEFGGSTGDGKAESENVLCGYMMGRTVENGPGVTSGERGRTPRISWEHKISKMPKKRTIEQDTCI